MSHFDIAATQRTPHLLFDIEQGVFLMEGESYPEDVKAVFDVPMAAVSRHLSGRFEQEMVFAFKLKYFNSSSAKVLMDLFLAIEESAQNGNVLRVEWHHEADDDNMQELGEEFCEELNLAKFEILQI